MPNSMVIRISNYVGIHFIETSALDSNNVESAFVNIIHEIYKQTLHDQ